jgi:hypothetical protein
MERKLLKLTITGAISLVKYNVCSVLRLCTKAYYSEMFKKLEINYADERLVTSLARNAQSFAVT